MFPAVVDAFKDVAETWIDGDKWLIYKEDNTSAQIAKAVCKAMSFIKVPCKT